jgi:hypothetical protein
LEPAIVIKEELTTGWRLNLLRCVSEDCSRLDDSLRICRSTMLRGWRRYVVRNSAFVDSPEERHDPSALLLELCRIKLGDVSVVVAPQEDQLPDHCSKEATIHPILLAIKPVGLPIKHARRTVLLISLIMQGPNNSTVVMAHVVVEGGLQWVVVMNHARLRIVHTDREVTGRVAGIDQPSWSMIVETWDQYHVRSSDIPVCECCGSKGAIPLFSCSHIRVLHCSEVLGEAEGRRHHSSRSTAQCKYRH